MSVAQQLIEYIQQEVIRRPGMQIGEDTPLVTSGLIDSLALVQLLLKLEDVTHRRIPAANSRAGIPGENAWTTFLDIADSRPLRRHCMSAAFRFESSMNVSPPRTATGMSQTTCRFL